MAISSQIGPVPAAFSGAILSRRIKRLFFATRPKFFPASMLPIIAGTVWGWQETQNLDLIAVLLALLTWLAIDPRYQSTGIVRILPREAKLLYADADDSRLRLYDAFTHAEVHLMGSRPVLESAWDSLHHQHHDNDDRGCGRASSGIACA